MKTRGASLFFKFVDDIEKLGDLPGKRNLDHWAGFFIASTTREYRNQGLAGELYNRSIRFLKAEGFKHALVVVTSPWTKRATKNREFEEVARVQFKDLVDFEGGKMFDEGDVEGDGMFAQLMLRVL